ncbi:hypothetical protein J6W34_08660 [bacterium]|nr:hypothetical protein [bacterium]
MTLLPNLYLIVKGIPSYSNKTFGISPYKLSCCEIVFGNTYVILFKRLLIPSLIEEGFIQ